MVWYFFINVDMILLYDLVIMFFFVYKNELKCLSIWKLDIGFYYMFNYNVWLGNYEFFKIGK